MLVNERRECMRSALTSLAGLVETGVLKRQGRS